MGSVCDDSSSGNDEFSSEDKEEVEVEVGMDFNSPRNLKPSLVTASPGKKVSFKAHWTHANSIPSNEMEDTERHNNYTFFKTKSGSLERQVTRLYSRRSRPGEESTENQTTYDSDQDAVDSQLMHSSTLSARRYFAA